MTEEILFSTGPCALGTLLVARTGRGVCAIFLGDDTGRLLRDLRRQFPQASLRDAGAQLAPLLSRITDFVVDPAMRMDFPLDLRGSAFRLRVWSALREIPCGKTETYGELARRIGDSGTAKEVGEACAANALALAIPCHRVLPKAGGLAGYRWGIERKRALLEREGVHLPATADLFE